MSLPNSSSEGIIWFLASQGLLGLLITLGLYWIKSVMADLKENTKSTHSIAVKTAQTDVKVEGLGESLAAVKSKVNDLNTSVIELKTRERVARGAD